MKTMLKENALMIIYLSFMAAIVAVAYIFG